MRTEPIVINPIGIIHTPFKNISNIPIQPTVAEGICGSIEIFPEYMEGLQDLEGFSHITLLYHFHKINGYNLVVTPFMDDKNHGIFATKSPKRPNAIGLSTVKLLGITGNVLQIEMVDMLDGTPLVDIKPFFPMYDNRQNCQAGWLDKVGSLPNEKLRSDDRFK